MKHIILLVDDDPLILKTLQQRFDGWEMDVRVASTPEQAKDTLQTVTPEIIVLDLLLTKEDGSSGIIDYVKSQEHLQHVPILVLTNLDKPELRQMLQSQGVKEYLIKGSMSLDDLFEKVKSYLEPQAGDRE